MWLGKLNRSFPKPGVTRLFFLWLSRGSPQPGRHRGCAHSYPLCLLQNWKSALARGGVGHLRAALVGLQLSITFRVETSPTQNKHGQVLQRSPPARSSRLGLSLRVTTKSMALHCRGDPGMCQTLLRDRDSAGGAPKGMVMGYTSLGWHLNVGVESLKCRGRKATVL